MNSREPGTTKHRADPREKSGTAILAVSFVIAAIAEILRHRGLAAAQRPVPANLSKPEETERGELQWHST